METLLQYLKMIHPISAEGEEQFRSGLKTREIQKKDFLLKAGHICRDIYFIEKGLLRCFYLKADQQVSSWFMKEGDIIISVESFYQQIPSKESIQALEDCTLWYMSGNQLQAIYRSYPEFNYIGRVLTERYYCMSEQRLYSMRMMRSDERYDYLMQHFPELVLRVPAKYLASYLGLSEAHLSVVKSRH